MFSFGVSKAVRLEELSARRLNIAVVWATPRRDAAGLFAHRGEVMPDTYTADCSVEELRTVAKDQGGWFTLDGADYVIDVEEGLALQGVEAGETVPMKKASRETVALLTQWFQAGRFKKS